MYTPHPGSTSMSESKPVLCSIGWFDLTVDDAPAIRDFYSNVVGWTASPLSMGDYDDFVMASPADGTPVSGVCHARGSNADLPAQWILYVNIEDIEASRAACTKMGGELLTPVKIAAGHGSYCVIKDPAGAVMALFQPE